MQTVKVAINRSWKDKAIHFDDNIPTEHPDWERQGNQATNWFNVEITLQQLFDEINRGHAVCSHLLTKEGEYILNKPVGYRTEKNFVLATVALVDIDSGMTVDEARSHPFYVHHGTALYTSPSHTPEAHRFRLVFRLEAEVKTARAMKCIQSALIEKFGGDEKTKDAARLYYGSRDCWYELNEERFIPSGEIGTLLKRGRELLKEYQKKRQARNSALLRERYTSSGEHYLDPDKPLYRDDGRQIYLHEIKRHINGIFCPFHEPEQQGRGSEFVDVNAEGIPFFVCKKCAPDIGSSVWPRYDTADVRFIRKLKEGTDAFSTTEIYTSQYIEGIPRRDGVTFVRSPKGTGKTYQLGHLVKAYKDSDQSVLLIGHRVQLLNSMAKKLELEFYKEKGQGNSISPKHYAICVNSLPRISPLRKPYDVVILDESEQVLQHLVGGTISKDDRKLIVNRFHGHIQKAKAVYCLDADLGELTTDAIRALRGKEDQYHAILNEYQTGGAIKLYQNRTNLLAEIHRTVQKTEPAVITSEVGETIEGPPVLPPVFITSNSKRFIDDFGRQLQHQKVKYFKITGENSESTDVERFIDKIDECIQEYRVILATPALGTGVDIQARCSHVFGVFESNVNTHYDFDQQLWRVRNPDAVSVFIAPQTFQYPTDAILIKEDMLANHERTNERLGYVDDGEDKPLWYERVLTLYCQVEALQNTSKNRLRDNFVAMKQSHGYHIEWIEKFEEELDEEDYSEIWEMEKAERTRLLLSVWPCSHDGYKLLKLRRNKTKKEKAQCLRYEIESVFKESLDENPDLIEYQEQEINWDLLKYEKFMTPIEDLIEWDISQREDEYHLIDLDDHTQRIELISGGLRAAGYCRNDGVWNLMDEFSKHDMDDFAEWAQHNADDLGGILDIAVGRVSFEPIRTVKSLLKETGMIADLSNRERIAGATITYYQLSEERHQLLEKYRLRRQAWREKKEQEKREEARFIESLRVEREARSGAEKAVAALTP